MKLRKLTIREFRNMAGLVLEIPREANVVTLVGTNGAGKSNILELISYGLSKLNVTGSPSLHRGDPLSLPHDIEMTFEISSDPANYLSLFTKYDTSVDGEESKLVPNIPPYSGWDGTMTIRTRRDRKSNQVIESMEAGGPLVEEQRIQLAGWIRDGQYNMKMDNIHHLHLDADRSYPPLAFDHAEYGRALNEEKETGWRRRSAAANASPQLYSQWLKYFISSEVTANNAYMVQHRLNMLEGKPNDPPIDQFTKYRNQLQRVLPHLQFVGVNAQQKTLIFRISGAEDLISYQYLSAGEREIAFVLGQIDRFQLDQGLLIIDEPELHLNAELIRTWITELRHLITDGQVILATHSLEAVEATGLDNSFLIERETDEGGKATKIISLTLRPAMNAISRAIGSPAYSLGKKRVIYIEGETHTFERQRYMRLLSIPGVVLIEGSNCSEVIRCAEALINVGLQTSNPVRVGGVIDRDFRSTASCLEIEKEKKNIHVLGVHEVENFLLYPPSVEKAFLNTGNGNVDAKDILRQISDQHAGGWIFQFAYASKPSLPEPMEGLKDWIWKISFANLPIDWSKELTSRFKGLAEDIKAISTVLSVATAAYTRRRTEDSWWRYAFGKQCAPKLARQLGLASVEALENLIIKIQADNPELVSSEQKNLQNFVVSI